MWFLKFIWNLFIHDNTLTRKHVNHNMMYIDKIGKKVQMKSQLENLIFFQVQTQLVLETILTRCAIHNGLAINIISTIDIV